MRLDIALVATTLLTPFVTAVALPEAQVATAPSTQHQERDDASSQWHNLFKRKGGGGGGRAGGGGGSSGSSGSSSGGRGSSSSNIGGATRTGSGAPRAFGGGSYYGGGAAVPYRSGGISPLGVAPFLLVGAAALAFWPGVWLYGAHMYHYPHSYRYYNQTAQENQTTPVYCACAQYASCGCNENNDTLAELVGRGTGYNTSLLQVGEWNGTKVLLVNGTLENGTTAPGGDEDAFSAATGLRAFAEALGFWPVVVAAFATAFIV